MPLASHKVEVNAPIETLWKLLIDKIDHPDRYVPGVEKVEIMQRFEGHNIERLMHTSSGKAVHEIIVANEQTRSVLFKLTDDPIYTGFVLNTVFEEDGKIWLDFTLHWTAKSGQEPEGGPDWQQTIQGAVEHTKKLAEQTQ